MTTLTAHSAACLPAAAPRKSLMTRLMDMNALYRQRRALAALDADALADLGLTRTEADAEAARPVWDAPSNWTA